MIEALDLKAMEVDKAVEERSRLAWGIVAAGVGVGVLGDGLLRAWPLGLNGFLFVAAIGGALIVLARRARHELLARERWLWPALLLFPALALWRDSPFLTAVNWLSTILVFSLILLHGLGRKLRRARLFDFVFGLLALLGTSLVSPFLILFNDIKWHLTPRNDWTRRGVAALRGVFLAVPLLVIFGALLVSADAAFKNIVTRIFTVDPVAVIQHGFLIGFFGWFVTGFLRGALFADSIEIPNEPVGDKDDETPKPVTEFFKIGFVETSVVLGSMNLLFGSFVAVQFAYLFGGRSRVLAGGVTYTEYARSGFFELAAVAALTLPFLLVLDRIARREEGSQSVTFKLMAGSLIGFLFVMMGSAVYRMALYQQEFGLTELRFYVSSFMLWMAATFIIFIFTVLRDRRDKFAFHALAAGLAMAVALNLANPDRLIVRVNLDRMAQGKAFDVAYNGGLSADAVPELVAALPRFAETDRTALGERLFRDWMPPESRDWRNFHIARMYAWRATGPRMAELKQASEKLEAVRQGNVSVEAVSPPVEAAKAKETQSHKDTKTQRKTSRKSS